MRFLLTTLFFLMLGSQTIAAISADELQELINQNDIVGVERAVSTAHKESLRSDISYDDLRALTIVLFRTHPDTVDFLARWRKQMPDSPYAMTAQAWALYNNGGMTTADTKRSSVTSAAIEARHAMHQDGMDLAIAAYERAPDYVPASDAVIRLQWSTNRLWYWKVDSIIAETMAATPNFGTLVRISGGGRYELGKLCETYANMITEGGRLSVDACIVGLLAEKNAFRGNWSYIVDVIDADDHPILDYARVRRALDRRTQADGDHIMDYLANIDLMYPWLSKELWVAGEFRRTAIHTEGVDFMGEFTQNLQAQTRERLKDDPYNYTLLRTATDPGYRFGQMAVAYQSNEHTTFVSRIAVAKRYDVSAWMDAASDAYQIAPMLNANDTADINAIAYSDQNIYMITNFMQSKINQYNNFLTRGDSVAINGLPWPDEKDMNAQVGCRLVRLVRLLDDAAERTPDARNHVEGFRMKYNVDDLTAALRTLPECTDIWDAPIANLYFEPIEVDRRTLLEISEDRYPWQ